MARYASFTEYAKAKRNGQLSESKAAPVSTGANAAGGQKKYASFTEYAKAKRYTPKSAQEWAQKADALRQNTEAYFGSYRADREDSGYKELDWQRDILLEQVGQWRSSYAGNKDALAAIDTVTSGIKRIKEFGEKSFDYYGQWDSQEAYDGFMQQQEKEAYWTKNARDMDTVQAELDAVSKQLRREKGLADLGKLGQAVNAGLYGGDLNVQHGYGANVTALEKKHRELSEELEWAKRSAYEAIPQAADFAEKSRAGEGIDWTLTAEAVKGKAAGLARLTEMNDQERAVYSYLRNTQGEAAAKQYLQYAEAQINQRLAEKKFEKLKDKPVLETAYGVMSGVDQFQSGMKNLLRTDGNYTPSIDQYLSGMVREDLADRGVGWQVAYDLVNTVSNMAPSILGSVAVGMINPALGSAFGTGMMGASAAGSAYQEARNMGYDAYSARTYSTLVGASEAGLQYLMGGIGKLGGKVTGGAIGKLLKGVDNAFLRVAGKIGGSMLSEGAEEGLQEILTPLFKNMTLHMDENVNWEEVTYSALLGALSGGLLDGVDVVKDEVRTQKLGKMLKEAESTAVNTDPAQHTPQEQAVIHAYQNSVDENLKETFESYLEDPTQRFSRFNINNVTEKQAQDASAILGGDYTGYKNAINSNGINHILKEHGPNGSVDRSMADINDLARISFVLENYDHVEQAVYESGEADMSAEFRTKENRPAPMLKYSKKVNGTYYVVEAIPESKYKKFWVVSAYMKTDNGTQAPNAKGPGNTPDASLASSSPVSTNTVPQSARSVKPEWPAKSEQAGAEGVAEKPLKPANVQRPKVELQPRAALAAAESADLFQTRDAILSGTLEHNYMSEAEKSFYAALREAKTDTAISGVFHNASKEQIETAERMSQILGKQVLFYSADPAISENGKYSFQKDIIYINPQSKSPVAQIVGHELTHSIEKAGAYNELLSLVRNRVAEQGGSWQQIREELYPLYKGVIPADIDGDVNRRNRYLDQDLVAKYVEEKLLSDEASIRALVEEDRSLGQRILGALDWILAKFGVKPSQERIFVQKARDAYRKALLEARSSQESTDMRQAMEQAYNAGDDAAGDALFEQNWSQPGYTDAVLEEGERLEEKWSIGKGNNRSRQNVRNRVKLSTQEYVQIQSARMAKYHTYHKEMRDVDYVFAHNCFYVIENYSNDSFVARRRLNPAEQQEIIAQIMEDMDNERSYSNFQELKQDADWVQNDLQRWSNRDRPYAGNRVPTETDAGLVYDSGRLPDRERSADKGSGNHGVKEKFSISEPQQAVEPEIPSFHDLIMQQYYEHIGLKPETDTKANTGLRGDPRDMPNGSREWSVFNRSLANKTSDLKPGEERRIVIFTASSMYHVTADGYMSGYCEAKINLDKKELTYGQILEVFRDEETDRNGKDSDSRAQGKGYGFGRENGSISQYGYGTAATGNDPVFDGEQDSYRAGYLEEDGGDYQEIDNGPGAMVFDGTNAYKLTDKGREPIDLNEEKFSVTEPQQGQEAEIPSFHDLIMQQYYEHIGLKPETDTDTKYSVEDGQGQQAEVLPGEDIIGKLPKKAEAALKRAERVLMNRLAKNLSVPFYGNREFLRPITREITTEYLQTGQVSQEKVTALFERAYEEGVAVVRQFYDDYKHIKDHLRRTKLTISDIDKADIADFDGFKRAANGHKKLWIVDEGGLPVDVAYDELRGMAPELFPERITHPANQLVRMKKVVDSIQIAQRGLDKYYSPNAEEFKRWARNDFEVGVNELVAELNLVKRYSEDRMKPKYEAPEVTEEQVPQLWADFKRAQREYEKVSAKRLLTSADSKQVDRLLRGDITLEHLNPERDNVEGITAVYEAKLEREKYARRIRAWNKSRKAALQELASRMTETAIDWQDKKRGIYYSRETMERNIRDIVKDKKLADDIIRICFTPVHKAAADANRLKVRFREKVAALELSQKPAKGDVLSESAAVQIVGEAEDYFKLIKESRGRIRTRDGKTADEWAAVIKQVWDENPSLDQQKIRAAVSAFRSIYEELFAMMNQSRVHNGYEPVNYRKGYFPHFSIAEPDGVLAQFGKALGIEMEADSLPTSINGITHSFKPGIQWMANALNRKGFDTAYDAVLGFDRYIETVADVIYQTENIQRLRALASQIRYQTTDDGIRQQVDEVKADPELAEVDKENRIRDIYEKGQFTLSNFVVELEEYTNLLAGKKSRADRDMEQRLGRDMYKLMKSLESRVAANMVAVNPGSWMTNFIPLTQGGAMLNRGKLLKGMWDTLKAWKYGDDIKYQSDFLTNRRGSDPLVRTWQQEWAAKLSTPMQWIDGFVAGSLVRARYRQNIKRGLSEAAAIEEADSWTAGVMADRSKGAMPTIFSRTNPVDKLFTQFQLEVNNQLSYLFKDMPREAKEIGSKHIAVMLLKFFLGAFLFNEAYEYFIGRRPALDPIGILNDTVGDLTGYHLPNLVELATGEDRSFVTKRKSAFDTVLNTGTQVLEELPFVGSLLGGGRIPISSALPDVESLLKATFGTAKEGSEGWSWKKRLSTAAKELGKPLTYVVPPFGGGQGKKILEGLQAMIEGGSYSVDAEGNDLLQYPVYSDSLWDMLGNGLTSTVFGKTSTKEGREWIESGFQSLSAKETAVYKSMLEEGTSGREAYGILKALRGAKASETQTRDDVKRGILRDCDLSAEEKAMVYYGLMASQKERELLEELEKRNADIGGATEALLVIYAAESDLEKWKACVEFSGDSYAKMDVLKAFMPEGTYKKLDLAFRYDIEPEKYIEFLEIRERFDANGNGSYSQAEVEAAIDSMDGLSRSDRAALWQIVTGAKYAKSNPYDVKIGQDVLDVKALMEEDEE